MSDNRQHQRWTEEEAEKERKSYAEMSTAELLRRLTCKEFGSACQIWYEAVRRIRSKDLLDLCEEILFSNVDSLNRFHCANSLIGFFGMNRFDAATLSSDSNPNFSHDLYVFFLVLRDKLGLLVNPCPGRCGEGEPDSNPNLQLVDSSCIGESQFSASCYNETWLCRTCGRQWSVTIYRDGSCRNDDPPDWTEIPRKME